MENILDLFLLVNPNMTPKSEIMIKNKDSGYDHAIFLKTRNIDVI